jgi:ABC-type multidrug transport system ATPase subunit
VINGKFKLSWTDLSYTVKLSKKQMKEMKVDNDEKQILKNVNGFASNGETLFVMGSSGAGKTTLLNALCDRIENNK